MGGLEQMFSEKINAIQALLTADGGFAGFERRVSPCLKGTETPVYAAFISVCNGRERAEVLRCAAKSAEEAWNGVREKAEKLVSHGLEPLWIKADITRMSERAKTSDVIQTIAEGYNEFFRRGIAFDDEMQTALIEAEINGSRVISYKKQTIELTVVNKYLSAHCDRTLAELPEELILFDCESWFCGEDGKALPLYSEGLDCGRRVINGIDKQMTLDIISTSSEFLSMMVGLDGQFDYGFYPVYHKEIPGYNIMRHASSIWSLICAYRLTGDNFTLQQAKKAINFMVDNTYSRRSKKDGSTAAFLAEKTKGEVKIGGNGIAVILLTEYMDALNTDIFTELAIQLGNGILELFDERSGEYFHVLEFPSFERKERFRTVYYDGEATFALCRLYGLTGDKRWLDAASKAVDRFIRKDYTKHRDHWVAYALNELTKHLPEEKYFEFGLRNANVNLDRIYNQPTTYHTYLELLTITFEMYSRIKEKGYSVGYLDTFDAQYFAKTIFRRAEHMLNGYGYPEYVMYLKYPERSLGAFFVRHDGYRIRIDDVQHFCGAYYSFYKHYDKIEELLRSFE